MLQRGQVRSCSSFVSLVACMPPACHHWMNKLQPLLNVKNYLRHCLSLTLAISEDIWRQLVSRRYNLLPIANWLRHTSQEFIERSLRLS